MMNKTYAIYETDTGRIELTSSVVNDEAAALQCEDGYSYVEIEDGIDGTFYIDTEETEAVKRPETSIDINTTEIVADGETEVVLSNLEPGTVFEITGPYTDYYISDNTEERLVFVNSGRYIFRIDGPFPALPKEFYIHAT